MMSSKASKCNLLSEDYVDIFHYLCFIVVKNYLNSNDIATISNQSAHLELIQFILKLFPYKAV